MNAPSTQPAMMFNWFDLLVDKSLQDEWSASNYDEVSNTLTNDTLSESAMKMPSKKRKNRKQHSPSLTGTESPGERPIKRRGAYTTISFEMKQQLIDMVHKEGMSVPEATKVLGIKYNTGKVILKRYEKTTNLLDGRFSCNKRIKRCEAMNRHSDNLYN